jgi:hypothetical protein
MNKEELKSLLQYKSNEMIPSTQLIRKSKQVFDLIVEKEIEKAIILRDGKPSFILMDFKKYEDIINHFINNKMSIDNELDLLEDITAIKTNTAEAQIEKTTINKENDKKVDKDNQIKKDILLEKLDSIEGVIKNDNVVIQDNLKDFWE